MHKFRQFTLLLLYLLRKRSRDPLRPVVSRFWVSPFDVELFRAVSHAYVAFAGLGRWDWSFHNINWSGLLREKWAPLTHTELVHYRRAAKLFSMIEVTTTLVWWDEKMMYMEHRITQNGKLSAIIHARGTFFAGKERISPNRCILGLMPTPSTVKPEIVDLWEKTDNFLKQADTLPAGKLPAAA
ncbi:MAG: thioesterase family protein [Pyrinomonadaceae bacterium]